MTTTWDTLLTAALLGTERRTPQIPEDAPAPLHQLEPMNAEHLLLSAASMMTVYRRAGYLLSIDPPSLPEPASEETRPPCSVRSARRLLRLIIRPDVNRLLVGEWLIVIWRKGKRIPHIFLLDIMQGLKRDNELLPLLSPLLGERGRWLAAQNSEWEKYLRITPDVSPTWLQALFSETAHSHEVSQREAEAAESLNAQPLRDSSALSQLNRCRHIWSEPLTEAFVARLLSDYEEKKPVAFDNEIVGLFTVSVPRASVDNVIFRLKAAAGDDKYAFFQPFMELLDLRRDMLQDLSHE